MVDEKPKETVEEKKKTTLQEFKDERVALEMATKAAGEKIEELKEFQAEKILSGSAEVTKVEEKPKEETPAEYANKVMEGGVSPT